MTKVVLVDDHPLIRLGLGSALLAEDFDLVGQFASAEEMLERLPVLSPAIVILDVKLSGMSGIAACPRVRTLAPSAVVIVLSTFDDPVVIQSALRAGAHAYFSKELDPGDLAQRMRAVMRDPGREWFPPLPVPMLTGRERSVLRELVRGATNVGAARSLGIGVATVKDYVSRLCEKFEVKDRGALIRAAGPNAEQLLDEELG